MRVLRMHCFFLVKTLSVSILRYVYGVLKLYRLLLDLCIWVLSRLVIMQPKESQKLHVRGVTEQEFECVESTDI